MTLASARAAFIGLGAMGAPMARHLMGADVRLAVYARRAEVTLPFVEAGAQAAATPGEAAREADIVFTNVTATNDVEELLLGPEGVIHGARPGTVVCDMSTISALATRRMAETLGKAGIDLLDCPVSGGTSGAQTATLTIMVGGPAEALTRARPFLERLGSRIFHMGPSGAGQVAKACNQIAQVITIQGVAEAMLFARANGVDLTKVVEALMSGFAASKMLGLMGPKMASRDFKAGIEARLHYKDMALIADLADQQGLAMPATKLALHQLRALMERGWGGMDTSSLLRVIEGGEDR